MTQPVAQRLGVQNVHMALLHLDDAVVWNFEKVRLTVSSFRPR
jgi:hypothetical protein